MIVECDFFLLCVVERRVCRKWWAYNAKAIHGGDMQAREKRWQLKICHTKSVVSFPLKAPAQWPLPVSLSGHTMPKAFTVETCKQERKDGI